MLDPLIAHVGILVEDIDVAIARFRDVLGVDFNAIQTVHLNNLQDPVQREANMRVAYSTEGPPFYELVEGDGKGLYSLEGGMRIHHIGVWAKDLKTRVGEMAEKGVGMQACVYLDSGFQMAAFSEPDDFFGSRFEFVDDADREVMERFMKTGRFDAPYEKWERAEPGELRM